jgi:hypothetical protein
MESGVLDCRSSFIWAGAAWSDPLSHHLRPSQKIMAVLDKLYKSGWSGQSEGYCPAAYLYSLQYPDALNCFPDECWRYNGRTISNPPGPAYGNPTSNLQKSGFLGN